jgi:plasmid maintenance system killer protein
MQIKPLSRRLKTYLTRHQLNKKFDKQVEIFQQNSRHPSLHTELLEPKSEKVYSFRIDRKYRVLFFVTNSEAEIIEINDHYQ